MSRFSLIFLGSFFLLISILSFINVIYSYYFNLYLNIDTYVYTLIISLIIGIIFIFKKKKDEFKISIFDKILTVIIGYIFLPLIIALPYFLSIYNIPFIDCYFESISGFTSTGFTIFDNIKHIDESLILWRSTSQWIGGLYFLFSIILLIDIFDNNLKDSFTDFLSFNTSETLKQSLKVLMLYSLLTLGIFICLRFVDLRNLDAFNLSLTIISSGGFLSFNSLDQVLNTDLKIIIFSLTMLVSFFSIFLFYNLISIRNKINFFYEDFYLLIYLLFLIIIFFIFFNDLNNFPSLFLSITSSISNIGFYFDNSKQNLYFLYLLLVIIGGSFFSTSSGIRFIKLFTLIKFSVNELLSHSKPKHILLSKMTFFDKTVDQNDINKYFLSLIIFVITLFSVSLLLTLSNIDYSEAFRISILTLMNTTNSSLYGLENYNFQNINYFSKITLIIFMIIGRVELLSFLILLKKFLFKN